MNKHSWLSPANFAIDEVELPEFGKTIRLRAWSGADQEEFSRALEGIKTNGRMYAAAVASAAVNENGEKLFDMNGDIDAIHSTWPMSALEKVWEVVERRNKASAEASEDAEKN